MRVHTVRLSLICSFSAFAILAFQNCSGRMKSMSFESNGSTSLEPAPLSAPTIILSSSVPPLSNKRDQSVSFAVSKDASVTLSSVTCQLDEGAVDDCAGMTYALSNVGDGDHTLTISAEDSRGQLAEPLLILFRVDATAPVVTYSLTPPTLSGPNISLAFVANDGLSGVTKLECALDQEAFATCTSPRALMALADGAHTFKVRATDLAGNTSVAAAQSWMASSASPSLMISEQPPALTNATTARFVFSGTLGTSAITAFQCSLNAGAFAACTSPQTVSALTAGAQTFRIRAKDASGVDSAPVTYTWKIDLTPPTVPVITANVAAVTKSNAASFMFSATDADSMVASYQCSLDNGAFATCTSPRALTGVADGNHSFRVMATDGAGNSSAVASFAWKVDTAPPTVTIGSGPANATTSKDATFVFSAMDPGSGVSLLECQLDGAAYAACVSPVTLTGLASGMHIFRARATDGAGNQGVAEYPWMIQSATLDGATLYANNCAGCHNPLATTTKSARTAAQITNAIVAIPQMAALKGLTADQVAAIAAALLPPANSGGPAATAVPFTCTSADAVGVTPMRRLTKAQYVNSLTALFDAATVASVQASIDLIQFDTGFENADAFVKNFYESNIQTFYSVATGLATAVNANANMQAQIGTTCLKDAVPSSTCWTTFITGFGLKAYRRPLTATEVATVNAVVADATSKAEKISAVLESMLQSPYFLYQVENGTAGAGTAASPFTLSNYEIASRMSFMIWDSMPDDTLFAAAAAGQLTDPAVQTTQINRMFNDTRARAKVRSFAAYWLNLNDSVHSMRDFPTLPAAYLNGINPTGLRAEVIREAQEYVDYIVFTKQGTYADLLKSTASFARTDTLASIYGHAKVTGSDPATVMSGRRGLLARPIFLSTTTSQSSPIIRGVRIKSRILCNELTAPGTDVTSQGPDIGTEDFIKMYSTRQRYELKTAGAACIGCHGNINPYGNLFETFDTFGRMRTTETNYRADGSIIATHALDTNVQIDIGAGAQGINGTDMLIDQLSTGSAAPTCFVRQTFRYYQLQNETADDGCALMTMYSGLTKDGSGTILGSLKQMVLKSITKKRVN